jgi:hypothetical protein
MDRHYQRLADKLGQFQDKMALYKAIVDLPFEHRIEAAQLYLGIIVLLLTNKRTGMIDRLALSNTEFAEGTVNMSALPFKAIKIPLDFEGNAIAEAIRSGQPQSVADWQYLFAPALTPEEARFNQAGGAIAYSAIYPLKNVGDGGALIYSYYQYPENISRDHHHFMEAYTKIASEHLRKFLPGS